MLNTPRTLDYGQFCTANTGSYLSTFSTEFWIVNCCFFSWIIKNSNAKHVRFMGSAKGLSLNCKGAVIIYGRGWGWRQMFLNIIKCYPAIQMTSSSRDIYFQTPNRNQTKLWPAEKYWLKSFIMSTPSPSLINLLSSFLLITYQVFCYWPQVFLAV